LKYADTPEEVSEVFNQVISEVENVAKLV